MPKLPKLEAMDLAALLSSRICHDIISPVGAIANGLELLDEDLDPETSEIAMELIRSSAKNASAKLQFSRIAFGAAGSATADVDTGDAEKVARGYFDNEKKTNLEWVGERTYMQKEKVKLLLNLLLISLGAIPRGGLVHAEIIDPNGTAKLVITATGPKARVPPAFLDLLSGTFAEHIDAHAIQPIYTLMLAESAKMEVKVVLEGESVVFTAESA
ncbi:MAG: histidine phosphotransferase [Rhizobiaceae bacterium]|nr:histidine phosphotransferase [Rhizobiaceae bacterium]